MPPKKIFVPDTNVLLHNYRALELFGDNEVVIPFTVLEELDKFKKGKDETNVNARSAIRLIDKLRKQGNLGKGVKLNNSDGFLKVISNNNREIKKIMKRLDLDENIPDNKIIGVAVYLQEKYKDKKVILVSQDINMRVKASVLGIFVENFDREVNVDTEDNGFYKGYIKIKVPGKEINQLCKAKKLILNQKKGLYPHQFVILQSIENKSQSVIAKVIDAENGMISINSFKQSSGMLFGILPKNLEQRMAIELLLDPEVKVVTLAGVAGTGKTLLALAAGLHLLNKGNYERIIITRPTVAFGEDIGFLPGEKEKKLEPWMGAIFDNLHFLLNRGLINKTKFCPDVKAIEDLIELESLSYIRGRSIFDAIVIVDEAQNLTPKKIKTIITRCGENSKFIFTGDPSQIDDPYLDPYNNGLTVLIEKSKEVPFSGHILLTKSERSEVAKVYAEIL